MCSGTNRRRSRHFLAVLCRAVPLLAVPFSAAAEMEVSALGGIVVDAVVQRDQVVRREGNTVPVRMEQSWKFSVGEDRIIDMKVETTAHSSRGARKAPANSGLFRLEEARDVSSRGGGQAVWTFSDGTLSFIRTFPSGAFRIHFAFADGPGGLTCTATEAFAREDGKREIELESPFGGRVAVVSTKQVASSCKVTRKK